MQPQHRDVFWHKDVTQLEFQALDVSTLLMVNNKLNGKPTTEGCKLKLPFKNSLFKKMRP